MNEPPCERGKPMRVMTVVRKCLTLPEILFAVADVVEEERMIEPNIQIMPHYNHYTNDHDGFTVQVQGEVDGR